MEATAIDILEPYRPLVSKVIGQKVNRIYVEDLVQETFRKAVAGFHTLTDQRALARWLTTVAQNVVYDFYQKRSKVQEVSAGTDTTEMITFSNAQESFAQIHSQVMYQEIVLILLEKLKADERKIIELFYFHGYSHKQIALATQSTEPRVRLRLHRLKRRLKQLMATEHDSVELFGVHSRQLPMQA